MEDAPVVPPQTASPLHEPPEQEPPGPAVIPWEQPGRPWPGALVETVRLFLTEPRRAFERVPVQGDVLRPVVFALIVSGVGILAMGAWNLLLTELFGSFLSQSRATPEERAMSRAFLIAYMLLSPLIGAFSLLITTFLVHLSLKLLGSARHGFRVTLRAMCYSYAPEVVFIVPLCGSLVGGIWCLVLAVIGISTLQSTSMTNAVIALLLPVVMLCCCFGSAIVLVQALSGMPGITP